MPGAASGAHDGPMINDITFALVQQRQQELRDDAAEYRLAHRASTNRPDRITLAARWNRFRQARSDRPGTEAPALRPTPACTH